MWHCVHIEHAHSLANVHLVCTVTSQNIHKLTVEEYANIIKFDAGTIP